LYELVVSSVVYAHNHGVLLMCTNLCCDTLTQCESDCHSLTRWLA